MGDVKLAAVMGLVLGRAVAPAMFIALIAGTVVGAARDGPQGRARGPQDQDPLRPVPGSGSVVAIFAGDALVNVYLHGVGL